MVVQTWAIVGVELVGRMRLVVGVGEVGGEEGLGFWSSGGGEEDVVAVDGAGEGMGMGSVERSVATGLQLVYW